MTVSNIVVTWTGSADIIALTNFLTLTFCNAVGYLIESSKEPDLQLKKKITPFIRS